MLSEMESELEQGFDTLLSNSTLDNLHKIFKSTCDYLSLDSTKPQSSLFCHSNSANAKSYIASMFLRIINECSSLIWENTDLRHKVLRLLDEAYEGKIHKIVKLDIKSPSHVKYALYVALEGQILQDIENISNTIVSLETAISIREKYIKALRSPLSRIFLDTHIYNQSLVSTERVLEFFNAVEQYSNANRKEKLQSYQRLNEIKNTYQEDFKKNKTNKYSEKFLEVIINKISYLAMTDFNNSDFQSKANIKVIGSKRKYPLHIQDKFFQIKGLLVNEGPGISYNTIVSIIGFDSPLSIETEELNLGDLDVGQYEFVLKGKTTSPTEVPPTIIGQVGYLDYENKEYDTEFEINLIPQNSDVDWDNIKYKQPYSLESVDNESELIGRKDLLETITEKLRLNKMESSIIHGQKRVGKTSLARTIQNRFSENSNYLRIFIETGSLDKSSPNMFIKSLGEKVIKYIKLNLNDPTVKSIHTDGFNGSLHPLVSFVEDLMIVCEKIKIIIVIDEFDEIPAKLYPYTESGDAFFHSLRSLSGASSDGRLSLILVGGENMSVVMQTTDKLNKFDAYNVGYFDKSKSWKQFSNLAI